MYDGYSINRTARIMGNRGRRTARRHYLGHKAQGRDYKPCSPRTTINIIFWKKHADSNWTVRAGDYYTAPAPHCATEADYKRVHNGMPLAQVTGILGHKGTVTDESRDGGYRDEDRSYQTCLAYASVVVGFSWTPKNRGWHVTSKAGSF